MFRRCGDRVPSHRSFPALKRPDRLGVQSPQDCVDSSATAHGPQRRFPTRPLRCHRPHWRGGHGPGLSSHRYQVKPAGMAPKHAKTKSCGPRRRSVYKGAGPGGQNGNLGQDVRRHGMGSYGRTGRRRDGGSVVRDLPRFRSSGRLETKHTTRRSWHGYPKPVSRAIALAFAKIIDEANKLDRSGLQPSGRTRTQIGPL